ncbi:MAG TPA: amidohydrolase family protein [Novosphingobium sp.]|nr:amidohydrolase family protein [Novosphingobium sp.]
MARTLISKGLVYDGTGAEPFAADILVEGERIVDIGPAIPRAEADLVLDAGGLAVAPGFVDLHTHFDAQVFFDPMLTSSCFHGVTSTVGGNCGFSLAPYSAEHRTLVLHMLRDLEDMPVETLDVAVPAAAESFAEYLTAFEQQGPMLNFGSFIGHSTVRIAAMGADHRREATAEEIERMAALVKEALEAGALGFATKTLQSARPSPSQYASREETLALLRVLKEHGRGVAMFNAGGNFDLEQVYAHQAEIGVPFTWIALLALNSGAHRKNLSLHEKWYGKGADVRPQVSCRPLTAQCNMRIPSIFRSEDFSRLNGTTDAERISAYSDPEWRRAASASVVGTDRQPIDWSKVLVLASGSMPDAIGRDLGGVADERGMEPLALLLDMACADGLETRIQTSYGNEDRGEVARLLNVTGAVLGLSDAGAHPAQTCDAVLPTDLLGNWVRQGGVMPLATAVHKLTQEPAELIGLQQRGRIAVGNYADIVVFDPVTVGPGEIRLCDDMPGGQTRLLADRPAGMHHILVNGTITRRDERTEYAPAGKILRSTGVRSPQVATV